MVRQILRFSMMFILVFLALIGFYVGIKGQAPDFLRGSGATVDYQQTTEDLRAIVHGNSELGATMPASPLLDQLNRERTELVDRVLPSVVSITTRKLISEARQIPPRTQMDLLKLFFFGKPTYEVEERLAGGFGSGVVISSDGLVLTSFHVIDGKTDILLILNDGRELPGQVVASDPETDLAVVRVQADDLIPLRLGDSNDVHTGELVCAIGNPFGLRETVSWGSISSLDRVEGAAGGMELIQHDATLHRGHSGGPLVNVRGELIGINRSILSDQNATTWQGIGFAIPANVIRANLRDMLSSYNQQFPLPGLRVRDAMNPETRRRLSLGQRQGVLLDAVYSNSPAAREGLRGSDYIVSVNGRPTPDRASLEKALHDLPPGEVAEFFLIRSGLPLSLQVKIPPRLGDFRSL